MTERASAPETAQVRAADDNMLQYVQYVCITQHAVRGIAAFATQHGANLRFEILKLKRKKYNKRQQPGGFLC